jgi:L-asparaginase
MKTERVEPLLFVTCGGTIDKVYFDAKSEFEVGSPQVAGLLEEANVGVPCRILPGLRKDSLEMTEADREAIRDAIAAQPERLVVVTHGTDTMIQTARALSGLEGRTIVLTGSMQPARFRVSDAEFNLGTAVAAVQLLPSGVYVAMNGRVFDPMRARKNVEANRFEEA